MSLGARVVGTTVMSAVLSSCAVCSRLSGSSGVEIVFEESVGDARRAVVEVCDREGCGRTTRRLAPAWDGRVLVSPEDVDLDFVVGESVEVTAELRTASGRVRFHGRQRVRLGASQPNGAACDGDQWPVGVVDFR